jgi:NAD(P)-dependent dehydrogenase (short-subunit alcohol dehydrogenase family)
MKNCANNHPLRVGAAYTASVENFDRVMAVNARSTMLCYKHAAKQMIAQGHGGRIIGANSFNLFFCHVFNLKICRGMFGSGQKRSYRTIAICNDMAHIIGAGTGIISAYSASKFAIRGLTQAAGMPFLVISSVLTDLTKGS